jgi:hypothetical protein
LVHPKCEFQEFSSNFSTYNNRRFKYIWLACILAFRDVPRRVLQVRKALPGFFLCIFNSLTCLKKPLFSKRSLLRWKVEGYSGQLKVLVTISKKWKNPSSASRRERTWVQALLLYITHCLSFCAKYFSQVIIFTCAFCIPKITSRSSISISSNLHDEKIFQVSDFRWQSATIEASSKVLPTHHPHVRTYSPTRLGEP